MLCCHFPPLQVTKMLEPKFSDIMRAYRNQPQAVNSVYREVLVIEDGELQFKDIIHFYNYTYVPEMQNLVCINYLNKDADVSVKWRLIW